MNEEPASQGDMIASVAVGSWVHIRYCIGIVTDYSTADASATVVVFSREDEGITVEHFGGDTLAIVIPAPELVTLDWSREIRAATA